MNKLWMNKFCVTASCLVVLTMTVLAADPASAQTNFGSVAIGSVQSETVTVHIPRGGTLATVSAFTAGVTNLDFKTTVGGSCATGKVYADQSSCTVEVTFQPKFPGSREGGVVLGLTNASTPGDTVFASHYLQGVGLGPETSFGPQRPITLASVPNLIGVTADNRGGLFYVAGAIQDEYGEPIADGFWAHSTSLSVEGEFPMTEPSAISVDGIGAFCVDDLVSSDYVPQADGTYVFSVYGVCPVSLYGEAPGFYDGAGNDYTLPGPLKETHQPDGTVVRTTIANLQDGTGLAVEASGVVYVASQQLYKLTPETDGTYTQSVVPLPLTSILGVSIDGVGNLYLTDATGLFKETLQSDGSYVQSAIKAGSLPLAKTQIGAVDPAGNVFVETLTDNPYYQYFYSTVSQLNYGTAPRLGFASTSIDSTSRAQTVTMTNGGNEPLKIDGITFPADFSAGSGSSGACADGASLARGSSCTLSVAFTPRASGEPGSSTKLSESVLITTNALNQTTEQAIEVSGTETIPVPRQVSLKLSSASVVYGGNTTVSVSLSAGIAAPTVAPTGTVNLVLDGTTVLGTLTLSGSGHGTAAAYENFGGVIVGKHTVTAVYSGDANNPGSSSAPVGYSVTPAPVTLTVSCPAMIYIGQGESCQVFTAPVMAGAPGAITYREDGFSPVSVELSGGMASFTAPVESARGRHQIVVSYAAQGNYAAAKPVVEYFEVSLPE